MQLVMLEMFLNTQSGPNVYTDPKYVNTIHFNSTMNLYSAKSLKVSSQHGMC